MLLGLTHAGVATFDGYTGTPFTMAERCPVPTARQCTTRCHLAKRGGSDPALIADRRSARQRAQPGEKFKSFGGIQRGVGSRGSAVGLGLDGSPRRSVT